MAWGDTESACSRRIVPTVGGDSRCICGAVGGINFQGKRKCLEKIWPTATSSTTNSIVHDLECNPGHHGNVATNRESYGSVVWDVTLCSPAEISQASWMNILPPDLGSKRNPSKKQEKTLVLSLGSGTNFTPQYS